MLLVSISSDHGLALLWAVVVGMTAGILATALRLDRRQWRKCGQAYWLHRTPVQWPFLLLVSLLCMVSAFGQAASWPLPLLGATSLFGFWINLDGTVRRHLQKEEERRQSELHHWHNRKPAEEWRARQSLLKRRELAAVQADSIRHLMDPHFLFNALNGVMHDLLKGQHASALSNLRAFKRLAVRQIHASQGGWWSLEEEWNVLEDYLQLELRRLQRPLDWCIAPLDANIKDRTIPAFLVQPLVENALWHGLGGTAESGPGRLTIEAALAGEYHARIVVTNTTTKSTNVSAPQEIGQPNRRRHATELIRQRLRLIDGQGASKLDIQKMEDLTEASLVVPCRKKMLRMN